MENDATASVNPLERSDVLHTRRNYLRQFGHPTVDAASHIRGCEIDHLDRMERGHGESPKKCLCQEDAERVEQHAAALCHHTDLGFDLTAVFGYDAAYSIV